MISPDKLLAKFPEETTRVIGFFLAKVVNTELFESICSKLLKEDDTEMQNRLDFGILSKNEFIKFHGSCNDLIFNIVIKKLEENYFISSMFSINFGVMYYRLNQEYIRGANSINLIDNLLFGFGYIVDKYSNSVFIFEVTNKKGDIEVGTGFLLMDANRRLIVTNFYVIESQNYKVFDRNKVEVNTKELISDPILDVAILTVDLHGVLYDSFKKSHIAFSFGLDPEPLDEIITMGYPSIPRTDDAYLLCHKGEVNSIIRDYHRNKAIVISAKTSSGNSGSPVIDETGSVVGMVSKELFEKGELERSGKLPYYSAVPVESIIKVMNDQSK